MQMRARKLSRGYYIKKEEATMLCLKIMDKKERVLAISRNEEEINLLVSREYEEGDRILIETSEKPVFVWIQLDDALGSSLVYLTGNFQYKIPFNEKRVNISPKAFARNRHLLHIRKAKDYEINQYQNLALNIYDHHDNQTCFPHALANVETRGESVFAAKNAIDGVTANSCHGEWPYASWGINQDPNAAIKLDFGREVTTDRIIIYLRADFPHDNWWKKARVTFSDNTTMELTLNKTASAQEFTFDNKSIRWLELSHLIPSDEDSPFPALTQIKVYGTSKV